MPMISKCLLASWLIFAFAVRAADNSAAQTFEEAKRTFRSFKVESPEEFAKIKQHYLNAVSQGRLTHQFRSIPGQLIHCIEIGSQDSVKRAGIDPRRIPRSPMIAPGGSEGGLQNGTNPDDFGMDGSLDAAGNVRRCPSGSIPVLVLSLEDLCRFRKLEDIYQKYPPGHNSATTVPARPSRGARQFQWELPSGHEYATAVHFAENQGEQGDFNLWQPVVERADEFSLSQLWVFRGLSAADLQTAEAGWQVYNLKYGDSLPHLFIFTTQNGYTPPDPGYYNLDPGSPFIQTDSSVIIAGAMTPGSVYTGTQYNVTLAFYRDQGGSHNWWLRYNNTWVGYYPNSWFDTDGLADKSDAIQFGGEIVNDNLDGVHTTTDMGSGHFPAEGFQRSAYIKRIKYLDMNNVLTDDSNLIPSVSNFQYYDAAIFSSSDTNWLNYCYFGGPGRVPVSNDVCESAIVLTDGVPYMQPTLGAADDPSACAGNTSHGVWFTFTPLQSGLATVDTCGSDFNTAIEVLTGTCSNLNSIACNVGAGPLCQSVQASITFSCTAGTTYYICAGGYSGSSGNLQVRAGVHRPVIDPRLGGASTGNVLIAWSSLSGINYQVQYKTNLNDSMWRVLSNIQATSSLTSVQDPTAPLPARRFYRVMVQ